MDALVRCQRQDPDLDKVQFLPANQLENSDMHILILIMPKMHEHYWSTLNACQIDADPDHAYNFDEDPDPHPAYHFDPDPDPNFQFDADPAPAPQH